MILRGTFSLCRLPGCTAGSGCGAWNEHGACYYGTVVLFSCEGSQWSIETARRDAGWQTSVSTTGRGRTHTDTARRRETHLLHVHARPHGHADVSQVQRYVGHRRRRLLLGMLLRPQRRVSSAGRTRKCAACTECCWLIKGALSLLCTCYVKRKSAHSCITMGPMTEQFAHV